MTNQAAFKLLDAFVLMRLINAEEDNIMVDANAARAAKSALDSIRRYVRLHQSPTRIEYHK